MGDHKRQNLEELIRKSKCLGQKAKRKEKKRKGVGIP